MINSLKATGFSGPGESENTIQYLLKTGDASEMKEINNEQEVKAII